MENLTKMDDSNLWKPPHFFSLVVNVAVMMPSQRSPVVNSNTTTRAPGRFYFRMHEETLLG